MPLHFEGKKKLLVLFGSPNGQGCTRKLLDSFLVRFRENNSWEITEINAYEENVHPCTGCKSCAKKEGCVFDDFDRIDKELRASDLLVVASPVYNCSFPSPLKAVLDRTQRYFEARFSLGIRPPGGFCGRGDHVSAFPCFHCDEHRACRLRRLGRYRSGRTEKGGSATKSPRNRS